MKHIHALVAVAIIFSLGYSQCTGGIFAIPATLATAPTAAEEKSGLLMSIERNLCLAQNTDHSTNDIYPEEEHQGCGNSSACLEQAKQLLNRSVSISIFNNTINIVPASIPVLVSTEDTQNHRFLLARAGPLFEGTDVHAKSIVKLE